MKKIIIIANILLISLVAKAGDTLISFAEMPANARDFATQVFPDKKIASVQKDSAFLGLITEGYEVVYADGCSIEFDSDGNWTEISAKTSAVPLSVIPEVIVTFLNENFKDKPVKKIEKDSKGYEVKVHPDSELKFNESFVFIGMD